MGYSIGNIVYGISPNIEMRELIDKHELVDFDGFTTYYSGHNPTPIMIGSFIKSINECNDVDLTILLV